MGINELFDGESFPVRPDTPDFWRLSEIILQMDGAMDAAKGDEDAQNVVWNRFVEDKVHGDSLYYMGFQRALRTLGLTTASEARANFDELIKMIILYSEAFAVGVAFAERGGSQAG